MPQVNQSRSRRRTPEEWMQLLEAYTSSGLGQRQFCREQGLGYSTFGKWKKRLSAPPQPPEMDLLELTPALPDSSSPWAVELTLGAGMVLRIRHS